MTPSCFYTSLLILLVNNSLTGYFLHLQRFGSDGLKLVNHEDTVSFGQAALKLTFDPGSPEKGLLTAECRLDHPFFVKNKGTVELVLQYLIAHNKN